MRPKSISWNRVAVILSLVGLVVPLALRAADPPAPAAAPARLADVLGDTNAWTITPATATATMDGATPVLAPAAGQYLSLESKTRFTGPMEYVLVCRLRPAKGASASATLQMICATLPDKTAQSLGVSISGAGGTESVNYSTSLQQAKPVSHNGVLGLQAVTERSLAWSEELRRTIEAQMAQAPKLTETVFTVRCTVDRGRARSYLNGRFLYETKLPEGMDPSGTVRIQLYNAAPLLSIRAQPLPAVDARFEPVLIDSQLNAATVAGKKINRASLPAAGKIGPVDGVPFAFPAPDVQGEDHLDVGASWTRFGALPGYIAANFGTFGGRWISADKIDPSRISMYVPQGRYKALHLIAVADGAKDKVPVVTAQFYRPNAGHPYNFSGRVPELSARHAGTAKAVPVKTSDGKNLQLYHVIIPLDPDAFSWFSDLERIGLELTKEVQFYRGYPDPLEYSWHGAGLPSSVQIYAMTLEREGVDITILPDQFGHVWTAPTAPRYTIELRNGTGVATTAKLAIDTKSQDGLDTTHQEQQVSLPATDTPVKVQIALKPTRYGLQELTVALAAGTEKATYRRNFAYLHADTRERGDWDSGRGSIFGFWGWGGGHDTPTADKELPVMAAAGAETSTANYSKYAPEIRALAEKYHFLSEAAFEGGSMYVSGFVNPVWNAPKFDPAHPQDSAKAMMDVLRKIKCEPSPVSRPTYLPFFAEPQIGPITCGIWPSYYGVDYKLSKEEQATFQDMLAKYMASAGAVRAEWPNVKLLLPYGDPMNAAVFLRLAPETRTLVDGTALDLPGFERTPEQQINQVVLNRMCPIFKDIKQYVKDPYFVLIEGTCISSKDIDTGEKEQSEIATRDFLVLMGYGVTRFDSCNAPFDCANYWGENHYGGGWCSRLPLAMPKPAYVQYATLTRHVNRANFTKYVPTGSTSVYCEQFKHYKTGKLIHALWTIRGQRPVTVKVPAGATVELYDPNDNVTMLKEKNGTVTFAVDQQPRYLEGLAGDPEIALGESDHSDAKPAKENAKLGNLGDGSWKLVEKEDAEYAHNKPLQIERFLAKMTAQSVEAPKDMGAKALAVHLEKQEIERGMMPYYTTFEPKSPVVIPGKASHLGLWVKAASDWGRVVYVLRDAKNEKWVSVGTKEEWNNDDIHTWSAFCFDGWRYLRFELPSSAPYDCYREYGTTWWGSYGGDGIVDLPVKLEKIIVERRSQVIYGIDLVPARPDDVLLGDLYAEYANAADNSKEAVRLSKLRMPVTPTAPELGNPIADLAKTGVGAPTKVLKVTDPVHQYDGTRCHVHFDLVAGAKSYDVWVSPYADGRGAMKLGPAWTESGKLVEGLRPDMEFNVFVVYTDADGKLSKPSAPLKFTLKDRFGYK